MSDLLRMLKISVLSWTEWGGRVRIANAQESVKVVMFIIELAQEKNNSKVQQLVNELVSAKERGVDVEVILDADVDFVR